MGCQVIPTIIELSIRLSSYEALDLSPLELSKVSMDAHSHVMLMSAWRVILRYVVIIKRCAKA